MSEKTKHNEQLDDIFRYLNDSMTNAERHTFERELERDVFSYEAFEGLSKLKPSEIEKDLRSLDVIEGKKRKSQKWIKWVSIAAGFLVVLTISFFVYENIGSIKFSTARREIKTLPEEVNEPLTFKKEQFKNTPSDTVAIMLADAGTDVKPEASAISTTGALSNVANTTLKSEREALKKKSLQQITTEQPLSSSVAAELNENADESLPAVEEKVNEPIKDELPKYTPEETAKKEEALKRPGINAEPQPMGGAALFRQYIDQNTIYPADLEKKERITLRVNFTISKTGNPVNIRVDKSPSEEFTKEAIRIIDSGPRWSPKIKDGIPVEGEMSVRITFKPKN